jgi:hypothetical protein
VPEAIGEVVRSVQVVRAKVVGPIGKTEPIA